MFSGDIYDSISGSFNMILLSLILFVLIVSAIQKLEQLTARMRVTD